MKLYHKNPRQITDKQFTDLGGSLSRLGDLGGIVHDLNSDEIIGGNQRSRVFDINQCEIELKEQYIEPDEQGTVGLGFVIWKGKKYAYRQVRWTAKQCEEANIRANKNGGSFDFDTLANEFELDDLLEWGFDRKELDLDLWAGPVQDDPGAQMDKAEELREKWGVESGQLWKLGEHRLICGDCTNRAVVESVMRGEKAVLCFTSPPYPGAEMWKTEGAKLIKVGNDCLELLLSILIPSGFLVWNTCDMANGNSGYVPNIARDTIKALELGFIKRGEIIWHKTMSYLPPPPFTRRPTIPNNTHESILIFILGDWKPRDKEGVLNETQMEWNRNTVWKIGTESAKSIGHIAPFPIELADRCLSLWSRENEIVYDPFLGSGTTLIACERLGRKCRAVEISPAYCAIAIQRWVDMTGGIPELLDVQT